MRRGVWITLLCTVSGSSAALAQEVDWKRFYPLEVGDTWEYTYEKERCWTHPPDSCTMQIEVVVRRAVTGEVEIEGLTFAEVAVEVLDPITLEPGCEATYGVRLDEETVQIEVEAVSGTCNAAFSAFEEMVALTGGTVYDDEFEIGGLPYDLAVLSSRSEPTAFDELYTWYGRDVGLLVLRDVTHVAGSGLNTYERLVLQYAEVGGVVYGQPVVSNESPALSNGALAATLYPNPARDHVSLSLEGTASERAEVEVFDVLGRRVLYRDKGVQAAGLRQHRLDLSGIPAGLYVVRATAESGATTTRRLVKVD